MISRRLDFLVFFAALAAAASLTVWAYLPGVHGPLLLDDETSVSSLNRFLSSPGMAWDAVFQDVSGPLGRPVAVATFIAEKLYFDGRVETSKAINILLHALVGILVGCLFYRLLECVKLPGSKSFSVVGAFLWLAAPLNISTVLYVVQRMAVLSAAFILCALICYTYARRSSTALVLRVVFSLLYLLFALAALYSKETAIVLVPITILMELLWFQCRNDDGTVCTRGRNFLLFCVFIGAISCALLIWLKFDWFSTGYSQREFSLTHRLLTESRLVWDYVFQWFTPDLSKIGLYHDDIVISDSLLVPKSTLYALVAWALVACLSMVLLRFSVGRYLVFPLLWFLIGHGPESTVLPLELYFEHRNYLPGMGLALLVITILSLTVLKWPQVKAPMFAWALAFCFFQLFQSSSQVLFWSNKTLLTFHQVLGHPSSFRANADMAVWLANAGSLEQARIYSLKAFDSSREERVGDYLVRDMALSCLANEPVPAELIRNLGESSSGARPLSSVSTLHALVRMLQDDVCPVIDRKEIADQLARMFLVDHSTHKASSNIYASLAVLENSLMRFSNAYSYTRRYLDIEPNATRGLLMQLHFTTALGKVDEANELIKKLEHKKASGELTLAQEETLALYTER